MCHNDDRGLRDSDSVYRKASLSPLVMPVRIVGAPILSALVEYGTAILPRPSRRIVDVQDCVEHRRSRVCIRPPQTRECPFGSKGSAHEGDARECEPCSAIQDRACAQSCGVHAVRLPPASNRASAQSWEGHSDWSSTGRASLERPRRPAGDEAEQGPNAVGRFALPDISRADKNIVITARRAGPAQGLPFKLGIRETKCACGRRSFVRRQCSASAGSPAESLLMLHARSHTEAALRPSAARHASAGDPR
jgi:hypothetical protein